MSDAYNPSDTHLWELARAEPPNDANYPGLTNEDVVAGEIGKLARLALAYRSTLRSIKHYEHPLAVELANPHILTMSPPPDAQALLAVTVVAMRDLAHLPLEFGVDVTGIWEPPAEPADDGPVS